MGCFQKVTSQVPAGTPWFKFLLKFQFFSFNRTRLDFAEFGSYLLSAPMFRYQNDFCTLSGTGDMIDYVLPPPSAVFPPGPAAYDNHPHCTGTRLCMVYYGCCVGTRRIYRRWHMLQANEGIVAHSKYRVSGNKVKKTSPVPWLKNSTLTFSIHAGGRD
eukprot:sb/3472973/